MELADWEKGSGGVNGPGGSCDVGLAWTQCPWNRMPRSLIDEGGSKNTHFDKPFNAQKEQNQ